LHPHVQAHAQRQQVPRMIVQNRERMNATPLHFQRPLEIALPQLVRRRPLEKLRRRRLDLFAFTLASDPALSTQDVADCSLADDFAVADELLRLVRLPFVPQMGPDLPRSPAEAIANSQNLFFQRRSRLLRRALRPSRPIAELLEPTRLVTGDPLEAR